MTAIVVGGAAGVWRAALGPAGALGAWQAIGPRVAARALEVSPVDDALYVATVDGVHVSRDHGETWALTCACDAWSIDAARDGRLMVGAAGAIHVSHDRGDRWRRTAVTGRVVGVACDPGQPRHMLAAIEPHGVWHSDDGGARFAPVATMPEPRGVAVAGPGTIAVGATGALRGAPGGPFAVAADQACHAVAVALDAPDLVFVGAERALLRSRTEVLHLQAVELPAPLAGPVTAVALAPGDRCRIAAVTARGQLVYSVDCCTHWHITQLPAHAAPAHALAIT